MRAKIIRKKMQKTVLKQGVQINIMRPEDMVTQPPAKPEEFGEFYNERRTHFLRDNKNGQTPLMVPRGKEGARGDQKKQPYKDGKGCQ